MSDATFTGERLHSGDELFAVDLARHEAAYRIASELAEPGARVLELGSGSGYGAAALAAAGLDVVAIDRVAPDRAHRPRGAFVRGDLERLPLRGGRFPLVVSFQVIEHLADPTPYVDALADLVRPDGCVLVTTPNRAMSDGVNPYHVHEYLPEELAACLGRRFGSVRMLGIGASEPVAAYMRERSRRIRRIVRLDPLRIRDRLPRRWVEWLFAAFAVLVRRGAQADAGVPAADWRDFPVGPPDAKCLDLLAECRDPR